VTSAQQGDDPIGLAELVGTKNHCFVAVGRHLDIVPDVAKLSRTSSGRQAGKDVPRATSGRTRKARPEDSTIAELRPPPPHSSGARPPQIPRDRLPIHVALVMDGNGRWAKARNLPRTEGHARGEASLLDVIEGAIEVGVKYLSAYAFSTENWNRSADEVRWLMGFNRDVIRRRRDQLDAMGVRVRWAGRRPRLWRSVISELEDAERRTIGNDVLTLQFCVNYGGRAEIVDAAQRIAQLAAEGRLDPRKLTEERFRHFLDEPDIPDVDLFVRSSGEQRTSNFLLWQSAYAELVFLDRLWPDFDRRDLWRAIELYAERDRRYGGAVPNMLGRDSGGS
jgi:undecaprenyl diphosphate synthase